jgi:hypothetical protein
MTAIFDMTRRVTMHDVEDINLKNIMDETDPPDSAPALVPSAVIFFDKVFFLLFSFLKFRF